MKTDEQLALDVVRELAFDPKVAVNEIEVSVVDGVVTLRGVVHSYAQKCAAEVAARRIVGVRATRQSLVVLLPIGHAVSDHSLASAAASFLRWNVQVPNTIKVQVERGQVRLSGEARWSFERIAAEDAVSGLTGVRGVINEVSLDQSSVPPGEVRAQVQAALIRRVNGEGHEIVVETTPGTVTLRGKVKRWHERSDAEAVAWSTSGVTLVEDEIAVEA